MREVASPVRPANSPIFISPHPCLTLKLTLSLWFALVNQLLWFVHHHPGSSKSAFTSLTLPNGAVIPNRIAKASMEENMADAARGPSEELLRLYETWAD